MHGLRSAVRGLGGGRARRARGSSPGASSPALAEFPFDHRIEVAAELAAPTLTLDDDADRDRHAPGADRLRPPPLPPAPGRAARRWEITLPVAERLLLDDQHHPDRRARARRRPRRPARRRARSTTASRSTRRAAPFVLAGGGRRIEVALRARLPATRRSSRRRSPTSICFEPMTAPADALRHSPGAVAPGESFSARFSVACQARDRRRRRRAWRAAAALRPPRPSADPARVDARPARAALARGARACCPRSRSTRTRAPLSRNVTVSASRRRRRP